MTKFFLTLLSADLIACFDISNPKIFNPGCKSNISFSKKPLPQPTSNILDPDLSL